MDVSESRPRSADNLRKETQKKKTSTSSLDSTEKLQIVLLLVSFQGFRDRKKTHTSKRVKRERSGRMIGMREFSSWQVARAEISDWLISAQ